MKNFTSKDFAELENYTLSELKLKYQEKGDEYTLNLPGIEAILMLVVEKLVLSITASVTGKLIYDKIKSKYDKNKIQEEIAKCPIQSKPILPKEKIIEDLKSDLEEEGIKEDVIVAIAGKLFEKIEKEYRA